jgi:hypothetical protein
MKTYLVKLMFAVALACCMVTACSNDDEYISWEPEMIVPLVSAKIELNAYFDVGQFAMQYFLLLPTAKEQDELLYKVLPGLMTDSVRQKLPAYVRTEIDTFMYYCSHDIPTTDYMASALLDMLFQSLGKIGNTVALDMLAADALNAMPSTMQQRIADDLSRTAMPAHAETLPIDIMSLSEHLKSIKYIKVQTYLESDLRVHLNIASVIFDKSGVVVDSLLASGEGVMPIPQGGSRITRVYDSDSTILNFLKLADVSINMIMSSDSLGLRMDDLRNLYKRTINVSIGFLVKIRMDEVESNGFFPFSNENIDNYKR